MNFDPQKDPSAIEAQAEAQELDKLQFLGTIRLHGGHSIFKRTSDGVVQKCTESDFIVDDVAEISPTGQIAKKRKIKVEPGCTYLSALNLKNALRKFNRSGLFSI